jgi:LCP family protein required for cell wall assembly
MAPRNGRRERRGGPGGLFFFCSLWLAGLAGLAGGFLFDQGYWSPPDARPSAPGPVAAVPSRAPEPNHLIPQLEQPMNVLFMANDVDVELKNGKQVLGLRGNTDTMILARLDPPRRQVRLLSIPRDTRVPIPGHGIFKINAANPYGGPKLAVEVVSAFLGTPVDHYMIINTEGVIQVVEALGGVNVFVPKAMNYDDFAGKLHIHLEKGWNHLDGRHAHDFLRFRHDDLGDIGRVQRQQAFLQAMMSQYLTPLSLLKTPQLLAVAKANMETDLSPADMLHIVSWAAELKRDQVAQAMVPGREAVIHGGWYWEPDPQTVKHVVQSFLLGEETLAAREPSQYKVSVLDGVGDRAALDTLRRALLKAGYAGVDMDGRADQMGRDHTEVIAQNADEAGARALANILGVGQVTVASTGVMGTDLTVIMGKDWITRAK